MTTFYDVPATSRSSTTGNTGSTAASGKDPAGSADRFLTLLVAQLENQDPLNPMDNAQVTSQMAQISTVTGIEKLNETMKAMNAGNLQSQTLQGAAMVGRNVMIAGNRMSVADDGKPQAVFELSASASSVKLEVLSAGGALVDTIDLKAMGPGRHVHEWKPASDAAAQLGTNFRVVAQSGKTDVATTTLVRDRVNAVVTGGDTLTLELSRLGSVPFEQIRIVN
jgi:flagellar basal-body rod modification protein FlgD